MCIGLCHDWYACIALSLYAWKWKIYIEVCCTCFFSLHTPFSLPARMAIDTIMDSIPVLWEKAVNKWPSNRYKDELYKT